MKSTIEDFSQRIAPSDESSACNVDGKLETDVRRDSAFAQRLAHDGVHYILIFPVPVPN
jgi:hypothetical protein